MLLSVSVAAHQYIYINKIIIQSLSALAAGRTRALQNTTPQNIQSAREKDDIVKLPISRSGTVIVCDFRKNGGR